MTYLRFNITSNVHIKEVSLATCLNSVGTFKTLVWLKSLKLIGSSVNMLHYLDNLVVHASLYS